MSETTTGVLLRLAAVGLMTAMLACVHAVGDVVPIGQIMFWRSSVALVPILIFLVMQGQAPGGLATKNPMAHIMRSGFGAVSMALAYLAPVFSLPIAAWYLQERVSGVAVVACLLGFAGV